MDYWWEFLQYIKDWIGEEGVEKVIETMRSEWNGDEDPNMRIDIAKLLADYIDDVLKRAIKISLGEIRAEYWYRHDDLENTRIRIIWEISSNNHYYEIEIASIWFKWLQILYRKKYRENKEEFNKIINDLIERTHKNLEAFKETARKILETKIEKRQL